MRSCIYVPGVTMHTGEVLLVLVALEEYLTSDAGYQVRDKFAVTTFGLAS